MDNNVIINILKQVNVEDLLFVALENEDFIIDSTQKTNGDRPLFEPAGEGLFLVYKIVFPDLLTEAIKAEVPISETATAVYMTLTENIRKSLNIDLTADMKKRAIKNTAEFFKPGLYVSDLSSPSSIKLIEDGDIIPKDQNSENGFLTFVSYCNPFSVSAPGGGATAIFCSGIDERIKAAIGTDDYILLPSSIHELIVIPGYMREEIGVTETEFINDLTNMVHEVNPSLNPRDVLSDVPLVYNAKEQVLEKAIDKIQRQDKTR